MNDWHKKEQLHFAAENGDMGKVKELVESGYDVNAFDDGLSFILLHYTVKGGHVEVVKYLLSVGANVNAHWLRTPCRLKRRWV